MEPIQWWPNMRVWSSLKISLVQVKPCIFFKLNNIWGWDPKPVQCGDPEKIFEGDGEPFDECPATLTAHLASDAAKEAKGESIWIDCNGR